MRESLKKRLDRLEKQIEFNKTELRRVRELLYPDEFKSRVKVLKAHDQFRNKYGSVWQVKYDAYMYHLNQAYLKLMKRTNDLLGIYSEIKN